MRLAFVVLAAVFSGVVCACAANDGPACDRPLLYEKSPGPALEGVGWHRLYVQGSSALPDVDGRFGVRENRTEISVGDHFLLSAGALVEWTYPVLAPLAGPVFLHLARVDDPDVLASYELFFVHQGQPIELFAVPNSSTGEMGYVPFEQCFAGGASDVTPTADDHLLLRVTNLSGGMLGVVIRAPDYYTWIDLEVR